MPFRNIYIIYTHTYIGTVYLWLDRNSHLKYPQSFKYIFPPLRICQLGVKLPIFEIKLVRSKWIRSYQTDLWLWGRGIFANNHLCSSSPAPFSCSTVPHTQHFRYRAGGCEKVMLHGWKSYHCHNFSYIQVKITIWFLKSICIQTNTILLFKVFLKYIFCIGLTWENQRFP